MTLADSKITEIFYLIDELCLSFEKSVKKHLLGNTPKRKPVMSCSDVIALMVIFHTGGYRNMKHFYIHYVQVHLSHLFPKTVSYNRFVELMQGASLPMALFLKTNCLGSGTQVGKSTMGYFFGFKLHLVINDNGELLNFVITQGNVDDRVPLKNENFIKSLKGKLYGDKGYISQQLTNILFVNGLHLITSIRNNMKNVLMEMKDKSC